MVAVDAVDEEFEEVPEVPVDEEFVDEEGAEVTDAVDASVAGASVASIAGTSVAGGAVELLVVGAGLKTASSTMSLPELEPLASKHGHHKSYSIFTPSAVSNVSVVPSHPV
jgi:hypothetical protein